MAENSSQDSGDSSGSKKKPKDSAFKQQRLPAWQPILTAGTVLPTFFVIGIAFIPIGIGMLWFSDTVREYKFPYTECLNAAGDKCSELVVNASQSCTCDPNSSNLVLELEEDLEGSVFIYYELTNFYQNHRRYVKSRDDSQLLGDITKDPHSDCAPFDLDEEDKKYIPCGAIANSLFSDVIKLSKSGSPDQVPLLRTGIAWESDKNYKFKNPTLKDGQSLEEAIKEAGGVKPRDWDKELWELDPENPENNGLQNEDLIVWMRTAALPNFRKLYRMLDRTGETYASGLPKGKYEINIDYKFRVVQFSGKKSVIISTTSLLGGKNPFLGIAYIVVGIICLLMGVVFLFIHIKCGKQLSHSVRGIRMTQYNST